MKKTNCLPSTCFRIISACDRNPLAMRVHLYTLLPLFVAILLHAGAFAQTGATLREGFLHPPQSARPMVFWHWMNGNISKEGIRKDLLDMKRSGIGGVMLFNVAQEVPAGAIRLGSPAWYEHVLYAMQLCDSLGITFINTNYPGWSTSGGPWIDVARSMKVLTWSEQEVKGGSRQRITLPMPKTTLNYYREIAVLAVPSDKDHEIPLRDVAAVTYSDPQQPLQTDLLTDGNEQTGVSVPISDAKEYIELNFRQPVMARLLTLHMGAGAWLYHFNGRITYSADGRNYRPLRDFQYQGHIMYSPITIPFDAVTARSFRIYCKSAYRTTTIATDIREIKLSRAQRVENKDAQIGRNFSNINRTGGRPAGKAAPAGAIDLTALTNDRGELEWNAPAGNWTILRMGYTTSGTTNHPAPPEATGLEVDKLDAAAVTYHFQQAHAPMLKLVKDNGIKCWKGIAIDSYEAGVQNWSANFLEAFQRQHGYDLRKYLPVLTGRVMGSREMSNGVLWDYRNTISDLLASNFYGTTRTLANQQGMQLYAEPYGSFFDTYRNAGYADVTMGEYWMYFGANNIKQIASAVHTKGQTIVGAEAFTAVPQFGAFQDVPAYLKPLGDRAFLDGLNFNVLHSYVHQPADNGPGYTLGRFGSHFGRLNTWWRHAPAWIDYLTRVQYLLQQGQFVADICVLKNDEMDFVADRPGSDTLRPAYKGYNFDYCAQEDLLKMHMKQGRLTLPHGQSYRVLVLPANRYMQLPVLKHLEGLIRQGLLVVGQPPLAPPGLVASADLAAYNRIVKAIWNSKRTYGEGKLYPATDPLSVLQENHIVPDFQVRDADSLQYLHRRTADADIYFIANQENRERWAAVTLAAAGGRPQLWDPLTGKISDVETYDQANGSTSFRLSLAPYGATFVVLAKDKPAPGGLVMQGGGAGVKSAARSALNQPPPRPIITLPLQGTWEMKFVDGRGAPASLTTDSLRLWNTFTDPGIKYYSGTATYTLSFILPGSLPGYSHARLHFGRLYDIAAVQLNGQEVATVWTAPYAVDVTDFLQRGSNKLEIQVTNRWINRLIGDQQDSTQKPYTFSTYRHYSNTSPLVPAGLAGPVELAFYP